MAVKLQNAFTDVALKTSKGNVWINSPDGIMYWALTDKDAVLTYKEKNEPDKDQYRVELHILKEDVEQFAQEYEETFIATFGQKALAKGRMLTDLIKPSKIYKGKDDDGDAIYEMDDDRVMILFTANFAYPDGNMNPYAAPKMFTGAGEVFEGRIGNGSTGYVQFQPIPYEPTKKSPKYGLKLSLAGVYVENLVEMSEGSSSGPAIKLKNGRTVVKEVEEEVEPAPTLKKKPITVKKAAVSKAADLDDEIPF